MSTAQPTTMASPNHRAGLAVVVPATENHTPTRIKVKQHAYTSPKKGSSQPNTYMSNMPSSGLPTLGYTNGMSVQRQPNGISPMIQPFRTQPKGFGPQHSSGSLQSPSRLLGVDEALQYSPFSSIVPFSSGKCSSNFVFEAMLIA